MLFVSMTVIFSFIIEHFSRRLPSKSRVEAWMKSKAWKSNVPNASSIIVEWMPSGNIKDAIHSDRIKKSVKSQKWRGLLVKMIDGKNRGVVTTRDFKEGEIVCDYHGKAMTGKMGHSIHATLSEAQSGWMYFYNKNEREMCIDAHQEHCDCHPEKETFGRLINHARKNYNLKPRLFTVMEEGVEKDIILFFATKDISVDTELLFDYGVKKNSFKGVG